jgi:3-oxoacyl-[acyl-carrier protein] reductase
MLLRDKVAIITGAAAGIGQGIAQLFAAEQAKAYLLDRDVTRNEAVASALPGFAHALACDVRSRPQIESAINRVVADAGRIDILINNAGIYPKQPFLEMSEQQWDEIQDINLKSMFHTCQLVLPHMVSHGAGKIVNISSVTYHVGMANLAHYVASKGGVIGLTRSLAREMGGQGIFVNCITPGAVLVETERKIATQEQVNAIVQLQSIKRRIVPLDIARACLFLSSTLSDGMTGQTLNVDGGWAMY